MTYEWGDHGNEKTCHHRRKKVAIHGMLSVLEISERDKLAQSGFLAERVEALAFTLSLVFIYRCVHGIATKI